MNETTRTLRLTYHGRIIDQLGIQMYQSPVAAVAELVSNAWDAEAENVRIVLPDSLDEGAELAIIDDGIGMTFDECQERYLNVGWCRRGEDPDERSPEKERPILGRKGIGKFAGFGIASVIRIETISKTSGEKTLFELDIDDLRSDQYAQSTGGDVIVHEYLPPDEDRKKQHGTKVILQNLKIGRRPSPDQFARSMGRRFLLQQRVDDFIVTVNDMSLPEDDNLDGVE